MLAFKKYMLYFKPNMGPYFCLHVFCLPLPQIAWLGNFSLSPPPGFELALVSSALLKGILQQDTSPTELPRPLDPIFPLAFIKQHVEISIKYGVCYLI